MATYMLLLPLESAEGVIEVEEQLRRTFPSEEYMVGYVEGYTSGEGELLTARQFADRQRDYKLKGIGDLKAYVFDLEVREPL